MSDKTSYTIRTEGISELNHRLPIYQQQRVLKLVRELADVEPRVVPGVDLIVWGAHPS